MPQARRSAGTKAPAKVEVILDVQVPKKHSVRFEETEGAAQAITNVYLKGDAFSALGKPDALKITIEAYKPDS